MNYENYVSRMKTIHSHVLSFITDETNDNFEELLEILKNNEIIQKREYFYEFLNLILRISKNHHRNPMFFSKIERIFNHFEKDIKSIFSSTDLFHIFKKDRKLLFYLYKNSFITIDESFIEYCTKSKDSLICHFFYPEIENFLENEKKSEIRHQILTDDDQIFENYDEKREKGENDGYLCELIRNDSIEEFIKYYNQKNFPLDSIIKDSIFETNPFLIKNKGKTTIIEYSLFFGSIQIFNYLRLNNIELKSSLLEYAIYGNNPEIFHILEENNIESADKTLENCLKIALKCHHNDFANYIHENLLIENEKNEIEKKIIHWCIKYHNYEYFPSNFDNLYLSSFVKFDYVNVVDFLLNDKVVDLNETFIQEKDKPYHFSKIKCIFFFFLINEILILIFLIIHCYVLHLKMIALKFLIIYYYHKRFQLLEIKNLILVKN